MSRFQKDQSLAVQAGNRTATSRSLSELLVPWKHRYFSYHWLVGFFLLAAGFCATPWISSALSIKAEDQWQVLAACVGGVVSLSFFVQKQKLEELIMFKELFAQFNERYDKLNEDLYRIAKENPDSTPCATAAAPQSNGVLTLSLHVQKQKLGELTLDQDCLLHFKDRHNQVSKGVNRVSEGATPAPAAAAEALLSQTDCDILIDYFNLCGEEYLYYRLGYIFPEVWQAWYNGMLSFYKKNPRIRALWEQELETGSYYGLHFSDKACSNALAASLPA
jgi:hypothetical protein